MDILKLDAQQVAHYEEQGFQILAPLQVSIFKVFFGDDGAPSLQLSWPQIRACVQFITEPATGRRERVKLIFH